MSELYIRSDYSNTPERVNQDNPLPVEIAGLNLPPVSGRTVTRIVKVPGVSIASAYTAGDAFGGLITFPDVFRAEKRSGIIVGAFLLDLDDEGLRVDMPIYIAPITATADNSEYAVSANDALFCRGYVEISSFIDCINWQLGQASDITIWVNSLDNNLYTQLITRGAPNIAATKEPYIGIIVVPD
jgi:hypothetical protein